MVAFVCFLCPGMFNALGGLGGGGKSDPTLADNMVRGLSSSLPLNFNSTTFVGFCVNGFPHLKLGIFIITTLLLT